MTKTPLSKTTSAPTSDIALSESRASEATSDDAKEASTNLVGLGNAFAALAMGALGVLTALLLPAAVLGWRWLGALV